MSDSIQGGGPAFPHDNQELGDKHRIAQPGMSLRDYFAAKAMSQCICLCVTNDGCTDFIAAAHAAYEYSDAMLAERTKDES